MTLGLGHNGPPPHFWAREGCCILSTLAQAFVSFTNCNSLSAICCTQADPPHYTEGFWDCRVQYIVTLLLTVYYFPCITECDLRQLKGGQCVTHTAHAAEEGRFCIPSTSPSITFCSACQAGSAALTEQSNNIFRSKLHSDTSVFKG